MVIENENEKIPENEKSSGKEFIIRYPEKRLDEILDEIKDFFVESIPKERRIRIADDYVTKICYIGKADYKPEEVLIQRNVIFEYNKTVYKK